MSDRERGTHDDSAFDFVAVAAHELRAPTAAIHQLAATLVERGPTLGPDQLAALHRQLARNAARLARLLDELLDLSRVDSNRLPINRVPIELHRQIVELVGALAGNRAGEFAIEVPRSARPLVDTVVFDRIVGNLITNALRYGRPPMTIAAGVADGELRLTVEDRGDGVSADFVPRLFDRFSRDAAAATGRGEGWGLGLAIAHAYATAHGGELRYASASPHGARFELVIPGV